jgi:hypothetical protein
MVTIEVFEKVIFLTFKVMITNLGRVLTLEYCVWNFAKRFSFETSAKLLITELKSISLK